ncbi:MAG: F420-dependent oxidoreductase-like protein [Candidatus Aldehydirespiratoraceae bacterium]|jgi:F420-dependent oxidoreductase-like protein
MKLSMTLNYSGDPRAAAEDAAQLERAGIDVGWVAELYSFDAVSILGYLAAKTETMELGSAILPMYSRTPTLTAMTAAGLDAVSDGRFILGIGASGPQVIEGWHGIPYDKPVGRQKELIEICRKVWNREVLVHDGPNYTLPLPENQGTGLGKPLKLINHPKRADIPVYIASLGPKNVELTAEIADGWLPVFFHPEKAQDVWGDALAKGAANRDPSLPPMNIVAGGTIAICDDEQAKKIKDAGRFMAALYVGGMGAKGKNFYNNIFQKYGYEEEAEKIQDLFLAGRKEEAMAAVPQDFLDATAMVGSEGHVRERIEAYQAAGVTHLSIQPAGGDRLGLIEKVKNWIS